MSKRKMKDSGVEWLGEIPAEWDVDRIGSFYQHRNEKVSDKDYAPLSVTMKGVVAQLETAAKSDDGDNRKLVRKGDFAINSRSDRRGSCGISSYDGSVSLINTILTPRGQMDPGYYNWLFHTQAFADEYYKWGHGIVDDLWTTRWSEMKRISIPRPTLSAQRKIAEYLDARCAKIDEMVSDAKKTIEEYKAWKASVIFESVTGKNTGSKMKDSGVDWIGKIPVGWNVVPLKRHVSILPGFAFPSDSFAHADGVRLLRGVNVGVGKLHWEESVYWNLPIDRSLELYSLAEGDLIVGLDRPWISDGTRVAFVGKQDVPSLLVQRVCRIRAREGADVRFVARWIASNSFAQALGCETTGVSVPHISTGQIENFRVAMPSVGEQRCIADFLDKKCAAIDRVVAEKESLVADLEAYKKSLIFECVTGKMEVA